jgi:hypothetical protein
MAVLDSDLGWLVNCFTSLHETEVKPWTST